MKPSRLRPLADIRHHAHLNLQSPRTRFAHQRIHFPQLTVCQQQTQATFASASTALTGSDIVPVGGDSLNTTTTSVDYVKADALTRQSKLALPATCPGCGALTHEVDAQDPGYYSRSRKAVKAYFRWKRQSLQTVAGVHTTTSIALPGQDGVDVRSDPVEAAETPQDLESVPVPTCDRCHHLVHDSRGTSIAHPSVEDIADSIEESPFATNHVYHVLDSADFPASLIPSISSKLDLARPRSQNRRSRPFSSKPTLSFIITRSDLLGPTKEHVDTLLPYFRAVLRTALGRFGENMRLGNIHLVSAKRGWWTKEIKDDIWDRGGGNWMVGKFNVGKSNLFEVLFPKGSNERAPSHAQLVQQQSEAGKEQQFLSETSLLPPAQPETPFPVLPLVSNLPGTTASPIRLPFGNNKGELIDLPGLERGNLDQYVQQDHKLDLVMTSRPTVSQHNIKPGQSLLLGGGVVRITPLLDENDRSTVMSAFPFVPIEAHVTSTDKATGIQQQDRESGVASILAEGVGGSMKSAGFYELDKDVTKAHAGPVLRAGVDPTKLPFQVFSTDIVIEGVGWVELVCQTRRRRKTVSHLPMLTAAASEDAPTSQVQVSTLPDDTGFRPFTSALVDEQLPPRPFPLVEIFTPEGKHITKRVPLGAWVLWKEHIGIKRKMKAPVQPRRPRIGMGRPRRFSR